MPIFIKKTRTLEEELVFPYSIVKLNEDPKCCSFFYLHSPIVNGKQLVYKVKNMGFEVWEI